MVKDKIKTENSQTKNKNSNSQSLFSLTDFNNKSVEVQFSTEQISSDGGLLFLKEVDKNTGLTGRIVSCIDDNRHASYVKHDIKSLVTQRIMQIAAGYEDANDCNSLRNDEVLKICCDKEDSLSAQSTMSRFENSLSIKELYNMAHVMVEQFIAGYKEEPEIIILDCDDTDAQTYGSQQLSLFNSYYGGNCFMPLHIYEGFSGQVITTILKPGRRSKSLNVFGILKRLIEYLRRSWPNTIIVLRGDSHFCSPEFMEWSKTQNNIEFITGLTGNQVLKKLSQITIDSAEQAFKVYNKPIKRYHSFYYKAGSWEHAQRVVAKVEVNEHGTNVRYITSSMKNVQTKALYEDIYCKRGEAELRIKDHKAYLKSNRMSCNSFKANQFRLFLHSAAYILIHSLQKEALAFTEFCNSTKRTIQLKIIKIATRVKIMKTKVKIEFPKSFPEIQVFKNLILLFQQIRI